MEVETQAEEHLERLIDESLEETFPASDPPAPAIARLREGAKHFAPTQPATARRSG